MQPQIKFNQDYGAIQYFILGHSENSVVFQSETRFRIVTLLQV